MKLLRLRCGNIGENGLGSKQVCLFDLFGRRRRRKKKTSQSVNPFLNPVDSEMDSMDFMTPYGKRILRERPVKPSTKVREMHLQSTTRGRGNRGRGN